MYVCVCSSAGTKGFFFLRSNSWPGSMFELTVSEYEKDRMRECLRLDREETRFRQALKESQGIRNLFWFETEYIDVNGQRRELTEQKKEELLRDLVKVTNIKLIEKEWPLVDWEGEIKKQITLEKLKPCLAKFCQHRTTIETLLTAAEIELDPIFVPYLKRNVGYRWPQDLGGATILKNIYIIVNSCSRPVQWESDRIFKLGRKGRIKLVTTTNWMLGKLAVSVVVLRKNPEHIQHLWVEIRRGKREVEEQAVTVEDDRPSSR